MGNKLMGIFRCYRIPCTVLDSMKNTKVMKVTGFEFCCHLFICLFVMSRDRCVISHVNSACSATYSVHDNHVISA